MPRRIAILSLLLMSSFAPAFAVPPPPAATQTAAIVPWPGVIAPTIDPSFVVGGTGITLGNIASSLGSGGSALSTTTAAATYAPLVSPALTGTVRIGGSTISLGGAFTTSGSYSTTFTLTGNTNVTLPTTGILASQAWVTSQGFLTSAPVTSVAGRVGAVTLTTADLTDWSTATAGLITTPQWSAGIVTSLSSDFSLNPTTHQLGINSTVPAAGVPCSNGTIVASCSLSNLLFNPTTNTLSVDTTAIATQSWVAGLGYLTSVPVSSVAGRGGAVTLTTADLTDWSTAISGLGLPTANANTVVAGPTSGGSATASARSLVTADLPASSQVATLEFSFPGTMTSSAISEVIMGFSCSLAANFTSSGNPTAYGYGNTLSTGTSVFTLSYIHLGINYTIGTATFSSSSKAPTFSSSSAYNLVAGDVVQAASQSTADGTQADVIIGVNCTKG